ncbi:MAG TPA: hypothetical protein EYP14_20885, partial [Planctomycetaceae bacterium]|nr:hypothetical protein [Planctomycetaceae bacterium]
MKSDPIGLCFLLMPLLTLSPSAAAGPIVELARRKADPYGIPRPGPDERHVPLKTSFYMELAVSKDAAEGDRVLANSVAVVLETAGGERTELLQAGGRFVGGYRGKLFFRNDRRGRLRLAIAIDGGRPLRPATTYSICVTARSLHGAELPARQGRWQFTTEAVPSVYRLSFRVSLKEPAVPWHGGFFTGFCKPSFCTSAPSRLESYRLMDAVRRWAPKAWSLQRDAWLTGMEERPSLLPRNLPNVVRERETRRIVRIQRASEGDRLVVEDFFGHEQYGIPSGRPLSEDYRAGDEVLIADGTHHARAKVLSVEDQGRCVRVTPLELPPEQWKLAYAGPLPKRDNPNAPGLFPWGGCYLRKFRPPGTPRFYWKRLDREWDIVHKQFRRRLIVNFVDAPSELSVDGRPWTVPKDYPEWHSVVHRITSHLIERYGDATLDFYWSIFNEPDLRPVFWRSDWTELQKFYDYTVDAILRAFEDHGYDSNRVLVGGLELGAIFGPHLKLREFLAHCSPRAEAQGAIERNAAFADRRLDGKRSRRVEQLCRKFGGRGSPCDFVSIHAYNRSDVMAAKLIRAKEMALDLDAAYYRDLAINSHESCPSWAPPPDPAAADSYLGNGYFPTWCADIVRRQLQQAAVDRRYGFGETILTFWPGPSTNFAGLNACTRLIDVDDNGDGRTDRTVCVAGPILHFLGLVAAMGDRFWVLPERSVGGHVVSGFASRTDRDIRILLYSHHPLDTQSRSEASFEAQLEIDSLDWGPVEVLEYRYDKDHNSYFRLARRLRDGPVPHAGRGASENRRADFSADEMAEALADLGHPEKARRLAALQRLQAMGPDARPAAGALAALLRDTHDRELRS